MATDMIYRLDVNCFPKRLRQWRSWFNGTLFWVMRRGTWHPWKWTVIGITDDRAHVESVWSQHYKDVVEHYPREGGDHGWCLQYQSDSGTRISIKPRHLLNLDDLPENYCGAVYEPSGLREDLAYEIENRQPKPGEWVLP